MSRLDAELPDPFIHEYGWEGGILQSGMGGQGACSASCTIYRTLDVRYLSAADGHQPAFYMQSVR